MTTLVELRELVDSYDLDLSIPVENAARDAMSASLDETGLLLLGEIHGIAQTAAVVACLVAELDITVLALEWPKPLAATVEAFRTNGLLDDHPLLWLGDGRITAGHLAMLRSLPDQHLLLFDNWRVPEAISGESEWSARDHEMAREILVRTHRTDRALVVAGNAHTPTSRTPLGLPMGAWLNRERPGICSVGVRYGAGAFYNVGPATRRCRTGPRAYRLHVQHGDVLLDLPAPEEAHVPHRRRAPST